LTSYTPRTRWLFRSSLLSFNREGERLLFKTRNSPFTYTGEKFVEDYVYLEVDAAFYLEERKILLFALDNITIGDFRNEDGVIKTRRALLKAGVYILVDCALANVPAGEYELLCLPLSLYMSDITPGLVISCYETCVLDISIRVY